MPNLTDELSTAEEECLNQFGTAVLVWCSKNIKFDRVCRTFVNLNLGSMHSAPSESDVAPMSNLITQGGHRKSTASEPGFTCSMGKGPGTSSSYKIINRDE